MQQPSAHTQVVRIRNDTAILEDSVAVSYQVKHPPTVWPALPYPASSARAKKWKHPTPLTVAIDAIQQ